MVDAQAEFALEHGAAVVEPCVERAFGVDFAQAVGQAEVEQVFKPLSYDGGTMDFFVPFFGIVAASRSLYSHQLRAWLRHTPYL